MITRKRVSGVSFEILTSETLLRLAHIRVTNPVAYGQYPIPAVGGPLDTMMGMSTKTGICATCGRGADWCPGHFGYIQLALPVFHPAYIK